MFNKVPGDERERERERERIREKERERERGRACLPSRCSIRCPVTRAREREWEGDRTGAQ